MRSAKGTFTAAADKPSPASASNAHGYDMHPRDGLSAVVTLASFLWKHPSSLGNRIAAVGRIVRRQTHKRVRGGPLTVRWEGMTLRIDQQSPSAAAAYYLGRPDWWEFDFIERLLRPGDIAVDVGANVGVYSLFMAKLVGRAGCVIACEPDADNAGALRANLSRNQFSHVQVVEAAVGDHLGSVRFLSGLRTVSRIAAEGDAAALVESVTLDAACGAHAPIFIKVDVEGFEAAVVRGARALMRRGLPRVWQLEVEPSRRQQNAQLAAALKEFGYRTFVWNPRRRALSPCDFIQLAGNNLLAIADLDFVVRRVESPADSSQCE